MEQNQRRLKWTDEMNQTLLECKRKAQELVKAKDPKAMEGNRKKGYMEVMKELFDQRGYQHLGLSRQNLRDQAARLEKSLGNVAKNISNKVGIRQRSDIESISVENNVNIGNISTEQNANELVGDTNLHDTRNTTLLGTEENQLTEEARALIEKSLQLFGLVHSRPGEYENRKVDTRTKETPTKRDLEIINIAVDEIINLHSVSPMEDPFTFLWVANCALYSTVAAFLLLKGWKKDYVNNGSRGSGSASDKKRKEYLDKATNLRSKISIANAELERLKENRKLTKKGKKNRKELLKECRAISASELVTYIEKKKYELRKLKRNYIRRKKQHEARSLNRQFKEDAKGVYSRLGTMCNDNEDRPKYKTDDINGSHDQGRNQADDFENIEQASSFWMDLWETSGTGNEKAEWLQPIKDAIARRVPPASEEKWCLDAAQAVKTLLKKRNWSAPGPDKLVNFWWKRAHVLHDGVAKSFTSISESSNEFPEWFSEGKTRLIPKPGEFSSENQRPITCLNNMYKWFTSCLQDPMDNHLSEHELMENEQRGAKAGCSGTSDNLMIDRMVTMDCHRGHRNLSMAWVDVKKAYDTVDHKWLAESMKVHRFPHWLCRVISKLLQSWNTKIVVNTKHGTETSRRIRFMRGLPQGDALCPRLFTLCLNPVAWLLNAAEGYKLSKPIGTKITHLLYIDDLKVFASSQTKLNTVLQSTSKAMGNIGLDWNPKKCNTIHVKRGVQVSDALGLQLNQTTVVESLKTGSSYKFLGVCETVKQDEKSALECAAKVYLQRVSVIWSSPLSDVNRVIATNQFALPVLNYLMWTQHWPINELRAIDRETRKIIHENGGKHPLSSTAVMYLPRHKGGRGLRSVEYEYKLTKIKAAVKLYQNADPTMKTVQRFEERAAEKGHSSLLTEAHKFAKELDIALSLKYPDPTFTSIKSPDTVIEGKKVKEHLKNALVDNLQKTIVEEKWHGRFLSARWKDEELVQDRCFAWMKDWTSAPTHTIAGMIELYEQLTPTRIYLSHKTKATVGDVSCRLCGKEAETLPHVLSGCSALAQSKYMERHNAALQILFFEKCKDLKLIESVPPWYSPVKPKPVYVSEDAQAFWDVPVYAEYNYVKANRVDVRFVDHKAKQVWAVEMSCPWIDNRKKKIKEKATKYGALLLELKQQHPGYKVQQCNIVIDVLGGWSRDLEQDMKKLVGARSKCILEKMQKATISCSLNIARTFKASVT